MHGDGDGEGPGSSSSKGFRLIEGVNGVASYYDIYTIDPMAYQKE